MSVDEKTAQRILELLPQFQAWHIEEYITLSSFTALTYYYLTSFDEEVAYIWSQKRTFGKIFYLTTRYSAISTMAFAFLTNWRTYMRIPVSGCQTIIYFQNLIGEVSRTSAEATLWLCLYALIGGKARYLCFLVVIFLAFSIPISVLGLHHVLTQKAIDRSILDHTLGYACNFAPGKYPTHQVISEYINLTRTALALLAGVVTIVKRYRGHNSTLLKVIKREGGFYYMSALVLRFLVSLSGNTGSPVLSVIHDAYRILWAVRWLLTFMFVDRLVLQMRKVDDPGTRAAISTLIFQHDPKTGANSSSDSAESVDFSLGLDTYFDSRQKTDLELDECTTVVHEDRDEGHPERLV